MTSWPWSLEFNVGCKRDQGGTNILNEEQIFPSRVSLNDKKGQPLGKSGNEKDENA